MKYIFLFGSITLIMLMIGCSSGKQLIQKRKDSDTYYNMGNYTEALLAYKSVIEVYESNNNSVECPVYTNAGESAFETGKVKLAVEYLKKASNSNYCTESTYFLLSKAYGKIDNLSLEMMALVDYIEKYPDGKNINAVKLRLFYIYAETDNYEKALELWTDVYADNKQNIQLLEVYFSVNKGLENIDDCNNIAQQVLDIDDSNIVALNWFGKQYYYKAEDRYRKEMKAYDDNRTNKQYRILLKALDVVTADFKKSLSYLRKIYSLEPTKENANYLSHIYGRLSDKKNEAYYKELAK